MTLEILEISKVQHILSFTKKNFHHIMKHLGLDALLALPIWVEILKHWFLSYVTISKEIRQSQHCNIY